MIRLLRWVIRVPLLELLALPVIGLAAFAARYSRKRVDIGIGPEAMRNHVYHKRAMELRGYTAETFVTYVDFVTTRFDVRGDLMFRSSNALADRILRLLAPYRMFVWVLFRYRCLYQSFNGGVLGLYSPLLWRLEPWLYRVARIRVVVLPYGGDVQDLTRSTNLWLKHGYSRDYPGFRLRRGRTARQVDLWTRGAAHVVGGCEWVDYMYHWDSLMLLHIPIDVMEWAPSGAAPRRDGPLRILHAPNHRTLKGTSYFVSAVDELRAEGVDLELVLLERVPNDQVRQVMESVDVVADQCIIGWYAMFCLEALAMGKPVLCYLRDDLVDLYAMAGLVRRDEFPHVNCTPFTVKDVIRDLALNRDRLPGIGRRSREFAVRHHATEVVGPMLERATRAAGVAPSRAATGA